MALTITDRPGLDVQFYEPTADFTCVRFHHGQRGRRENYSQTEIAEWAAPIAAWAGEVVDVFAYFNNDWEEFAPGNALSLRRMLGVSWGDSAARGRAGAGEQHH